MAYSDKVVEHYENPRNVGSFDKGDDSVGTGMVGAPACGDVMKLQIKVGADGIIEDAKFKIQVARDQLAAKEMSVGRYYLARKNYTAAINRFREVRIAKLNEAR